MTFEIGFEFIFSVPVPLAAVLVAVAVVVAVGRTVAVLVATGGVGLPTSTSSITIVFSATPSSNLISSEKSWKPFFLAVSFHSSLLSRLSVTGGFAHTSSFSFFSTFLSSCLPASSTSAPVVLSSSVSLPLMTFGFC